ncbi:MAG: phosphate acyltransferase PlsX [Bacteroidia bacterium]|nr:phosphate acyltransferase PlsX [Bacteroidia bacterium]
MRIGVDAMGGDFAPKEAILGSIEALKLYPEIHIVLFGDEAKITPEIKNYSDRISVVASSDDIGMSEHPVKAILSKQTSSIAMGFGYLKKNLIDGFLSAGNTGAMLVGSIGTVKAIDGVARPCITSLIPRENKNPGLLLDVGANADVKPEHMVQFAQLGSIYYQTIYGSEANVGLLNIGEEEEKGNVLTKTTHKLLKKCEQINFAGNVEGRNIFNEDADVIVCDGFTGNAIIKVCEGMFYRLAKRGVKDDFLDKFNFKHYGGSAILGINSPVIVGHGISKSSTFVKMIELTKTTFEEKMVEKIQLAFQESEEQNTTV